MRRVLAALAGLLASVTLPASASAFTPPQLYVRLQTWDTHEAASGWMPLASAARLYYLAAFARTQLVRAGVDPNPVLLLVAQKRFGFADPHSFPHCP